jgi:pimeloyl-ACP methyl ester carboxylesterase
MSGQLAMGFGTAIPICRDIADALREAGVATLLYDKRTCGPFNGCASNGYPPPPPDMVIDTELQDARAAIEMLRTRSEIDPARVVVVGHSQGASFVPELLRTDALLRGGVLLAAAFQGPAVLMTEQSRLVSLLVSKGPPSEVGEEAAADLRRAATDLSTLLASGTGAPQAVLGTPVGYWRSWSDLVARVQEHVHLVKQPMLILGGDYDFNVSATELGLWRGALRGHSGARIEKLPCVTHALNCIQEPNPFAIRSSDIGANVSEEVLALLSRFVRDVTRAESGP